MIATTSLIQRPEAWPMRPYLPLRHKELKDCGMPMCGIIIEGRGRIENWERTVFLAILGDFENAEDLLTKEKIVYPSIEAALEDWIVD